jgi:hypothetical protein
MTPRRSTPTLCTSIALVLLSLGGCGRQAAETGSAAAEAEQPALGVALDEEEREKLGVELGVIASASFQPVIEGPARVVDAQTVIGPLADLGDAEINARTSRTALERSRNLFKNDTAVSAEALEAAERQAAADEAQLRVARARVSLGLGVEAPWLDARRRDPVLEDLAKGSALLVTASFPSGFGDAAPESLALRRVGASGSQAWNATDLWAGPADPAVPGPTVLALLAAPGGLSVGERLTASLASGAALPGTVVPLSSIVLAGGEAWCYVATGDERLERRRVELGRPQPGGYFQAEGFTAGEQVVVAGAGLLLAREIGGGGEEE